MRIFYAELEAKMRDALERFHVEETNTMARCNQALVLITSLLEELRASVAARPFESHKDEIHFFKSIKPAFMGQYFFYQQILEMKLNEPVVTGERMHYYLGLLEQTQDFVKANSAFVAYCMSDSTHLDDRYFVRGFIPGTDFLTDRSFSTGYDEKISRVIGNKLFMEYVASAIEGLKSGADDARPGLTWTGSKADLIELIYGLETVGVINKGDADIKEIVRQLEKVFNISIGNVYRQFLDLRLRKKDKTIFLSQMKDRLQERMNDFG